ncbi:MAG TPA: pyridoxamine 5'-phosphate oxidase family protein [Acidimicrobiales bacterium]|nr:pyridoxamine 5'-phosphate oxidase family protein [Acidimicrobiales bacterium]
MTSVIGPPSEFSRVRRLADRAAYDPETIYGVLEAAMIGHVGVLRDGRPVVIPMLFGRAEDDLFLHGSVASQLLRGLSAGIEVCFTATVIDGLVYARSAFHHSMNYRSVVIAGRAFPVEAQDKLSALRAIVDHITPGRWDEARPPTKAELRKTAVLRMPIAEASAKIRSAGPADDLDDLGLPVWAGVVPVMSHFGQPVDAEDLTEGIGLSPAVNRRLHAGAPRS